MAACLFIRMVSCGFKASASNETKLDHLSFPIAWQGKIIPLRPKNFPWCNSLEVSGREQGFLPRPVPISPEPNHSATESPLRLNAAKAKRLLQRGIPTSARTSTALRAHT